MRLSTQQKRMRQKGQATLEFIVLVPFIFTMILIIALAGWWSYTKLSAQNAAYAWTVWNSTIKPNSEGEGRFGNVKALQATLHEMTGMKEMWGESAPNPDPHPDFERYRRGGFGITVWIFPGDIWPLKKLVDVVFGNADDIVPRGSSFFFYGPFNSAGGYSW